MSRHINIPIFVPHLGCPHQCSFCNQHSISGSVGFCLADMEKTIEASLATAGRDSIVEIAFFGGSFTGIDRALMIEILSRTQKYLKSGAVASLRCSTRPDYINEEVLDILARHGMKTVELGIQSMDNTVLSACHRGHTAEESLRAAEMLGKRGFDFVGQMMIGLPSASPESEKETARAICSLGAKGARVYPTVVFRETPLCHMAERGEYQPLSLADAVSRTADVVEIFRANSVPLLRVGLHATEALSDEKYVFAGPAHSALGELVESELYKRRILSLLEGEKKAPILRVLVAKGQTSAAVGQHQANKRYLCERFGFSCVIVSESEALSKGDILIKTEERKRVCT